MLSSVPQLESEPEVRQIGEAPDDVPFSIPEKWKWCNFGNVVAYGKSEQVQPQNIEKSAWILDLEDIESGTGNLLQKKKSITAQSNKTRFRKGDVLYSKLRPYLNKVIVADDDGYCTTEIVPISPFVAQAPLDAQYLKIYLMSPYFVGYANQCSYGVKMPRLGTKDAQKALFPIPPIEEQRRIVAKLNQLFEQIDRAEKAYNELSGPLSDRFRQLCLEKAIQGKLVPQLESEPEVEQVGDAPEDVPFAIPEKWKWVNLHSTLKAISDGSHNPPPNVGHGVPVLSAKNVINGIIDTNSVTRWTTEEQWSIEDKKIHIQSGDVLLTIVGTIGRTAVVPNDCEKFMLQRSVCVMKPKECVNPEFLALILNSPSLFEWIMDHASGTAQKGIYLKTVKQIPIPLPSIEEQRRIVAKLNELLGSISQLEQTISTP